MVEQWCAPARATLAKPSRGPVAARALDVTVVASRFTPAAKLNRIRGRDTKVELIDGDFDMARERAAAIAGYDGIRLIEDSLDIETCEGAATIGLELVDTVPSFDAVLIALGGGALATGVGHGITACSRHGDLSVIGVAVKESPWWDHVANPTKERLGHIETGASDNLLNQCHGQKCRGGDNRDKLAVFRQRIHRAQIPPCAAS